MVRIFTSRTPQIDRDSILSEFGQPNSKVRILVATTAFGMGLDVPDVKVVVQFKAIRAEIKRRATETLVKQQNTSSILCCDLWQRIGRAARGSGISGIAYVCLEYSWWSDQRKKKGKISSSKIMSAGINWI
jgi:superfamily II DNA/RNA helicase